MAATIMVVIDMSPLFFILTSQKWKKGISLAATNTADFTFIRAIIHIKWCWVIAAALGQALSALRCAGFRLLAESTILPMKMTDKMTRTSRAIAAIIMTLREIPCPFYSLTSPLTRV